MFQFNKIAVFVFVALYLQDALDFSPIDAGLVVMLAVVPTLGTSLLSGRAVDRFGSRRPLFVGLVLNGTALLLVALATTVHSVALLMAPLVVWGAMLPFIAISARRALMSAVPKDQQGEASGVNLTVQMLGGAVGMALCGALLVAGACSS
jgi:predicted MFS family arabinose efflux permease